MDRAERNGVTDPTRLFTDRGYLAGSQYATGSNLAARQSIYAYAEPKVDLVTWALEQVEWSGDERTLDVGCGNGAYLRHLAQLGPRMLVGADLSAGMVREVVDNWPDGRRPSLLVADVQQAPFVDGCFDVALAMHMLYHVPDMTEAARELRRVVRPGGTVLLSTNGAEHLRALRNLYSGAVARVSEEPAAPYPSPGGSFELEGGHELLEAHFVHVERRDLCTELLVPEVGPILRYLESSRQHRQGFLPAGTSWEAVMEEVATTVSETINRKGAFRIGTHAGAFVCR